MTLAAVMHSLTIDRLDTILDRARQVRVTVVGDLMLDVYLAGSVTRISPEAPVPVVQVDAERSALGGAANVGANVVALGAHCDLVGVVGSDSGGRGIRDALGRLNGDGTLRPLLVQHQERPTTTKTRVLARNQQVVRIDEEVEAPVEGQDQERLISTALAALVDADALVFEDYNKGALTEALITAALAAARRRGIPVVVDPKFRNFFAYRGATVFKPNRRELEAALGATLDLSGENALQEARARLEVDNLLLTLGSEGMVLVTNDQAVTHIASLAREVFDVSGAGDTVIASFTLAIAAGASPVEAAIISNHAAGVVVGKMGTATVSPNELLQSFSNAR